MRTFLAFRVRPGAYAGPPTAESAQVEEEQRGGKEKRREDGGVVEKKGTVQDRERGEKPGD